MKGFLQEYWLWILVPALLVAAGVLLLIVAGEGGSSVFEYDVM